jgi:hypothetical protein
MTPQISTTERNTISFLNRDHVVLVTIDRTEIVVTTTLGTRITIPASPEILANFADDLTNHVESNFVSVPSPLSATTRRENAETESTET